MESSFYYRGNRKRHNVDPLIHDEPQISEESFGNQENYAYFDARLNYESSEDEDWEFEGEPINNIFGILSDETD